MLSDPSSCKRFPCMLLPIYHRAQHKQLLPFYRANRHAQPSLPITLFWNLMMPEPWHMWKCITAAEVLQLLCVLHPSDDNWSKLLSIIAYSMLMIYLVSFFDGWTSLGQLCCSLSQHLIYFMAVVHTTWNCSLTTLTPF